MKYISKSECPEELKTYLAENPDATWDDFGNEAQKAHEIVQNTIKRDQLGICCYCEIDFHVSDEAHIKDFRVEHFYPKKQTPLPSGENAHLTWSNLLGCCHGGTQRNYTDDERFTSRENRHCDADKGEKDWTNIILNPLNIPEDVKIFTFQSDGKIIVSDHCPDEFKILAQNTIEKLNLNEESYLKRARAVVREALKEKISEFVISGLALEEAINTLSQAMFSGTQENLKFYSCKLDLLSI